MIALATLLVISRFQAPVERQIDFDGAGHFKLHGALMLPATTDKAPCVLLLPGSGPSDRDGNQGPNFVSNLLKEIAVRLASEGIATFRFDKRAVPSIYMSLWPKDPQAYNNFMSFDSFVGDAKAAFQTMKAQPEVDSHRAAVLGHSEGTLLALKFTSQLRPSQRPKTLVLIGAPGRTLEVVLRQQLQELFERQKLSPAKLQSNMDAVDRAIAQISKDSTVPSDLPKTPLFRALFQPNTTKMMHGLMTTDPAPLAHAYGGSVLLIIGEYDQDVSPTEDTPVLEKALATRRNGTVKVVIIPHASHSIKEAPDRDHDTFAGPIVPLAMEEIVGWFKKWL